MAGAVEFEEFVDDARIRLGRAFTAASGPDRGQEALAEAVAYASTHFDELRAMDNPVGYLFRVGQSRTRPRTPVPPFRAPQARDVPDVSPAHADALVPCGQPHGNEEYASFTSSPAPSSG